MEDTSNQSLSSQQSSNPDAQSELDTIKQKLVHLFRLREDTKTVAEESRKRFEETWAQRELHRSSSGDDGPPERKEEPKTNTATKSAQPGNHVDSQAYVKRNTFRTLVALGKKVHERQQHLRILANKVKLMTKFRQARKDLLRTVFLPHRYTKPLRKYM